MNTEEFNNAKKVIKRHSGNVSGYAKQESLKAEKAIDLAVMILTDALTVSHCKTDNLKRTTDVIEISAVALGGPLKS